MYRQYENPVYLQDRLDSLLANKPQTDDIDVLADWHNDCEELRERICFAWADLESEESGALY